MRDTVYLILLVIAFFALVLRAISQEEARKADRRQRVQAHSPERRRGGDRRRHTLRGYLGWRLARLWSRPRR